MVANVWRANLIRSCIKKVWEWNLRFRLNSLAMRTKIKNHIRTIKAFLLKGKYKIKILLRNVFPKAALSNVNTKVSNFIDVWTGEIESPEITIAVK